MLIADTMTQVIKWQSNVGDLTPTGNSGTQSVAFQSTRAQRYLNLIPQPASRLMADPNAHGMLNVYFLFNETDALLYGLVQSAIYSLVAADMR